jgi:hypothetical protein
MFIYLSFLLTQAYTGGETVDNIVQVLGYLVISASSNTLIHGIEIHYQLALLIGTVIIKPMYCILVPFLIYGSRYLLETAAGCQS